MTYSKPEIRLLGDAVEVVQSAKNSVSSDNDITGQVPAYELDE